MGDRTTCMLQIGGILLDSDVDTLVDALETAGAEPASTRTLREELSRAAEGIDSPRGAGKPMAATFCFEEVNYASLDTGLAETMSGLALSWSWSWEAGGGYGAGMEFTDAVSGQSAEYAACEGEIVLTLSDAEDADQRARARRWQDFDRGLALRMAQSAHDLVALLTSGEIEEVQADTIRKRLAARNTA